jgi:hypothetical protein
MKPPCLSVNGYALPISGKSLVEKEFSGKSSTQGKN